jgi:hypothetical protein
MRGKAKEGFLSAHDHASRGEIRPWKEVFNLDIRELEAEWLSSLDTAGKTASYLFSLLRT